MRSFLVLGFQIGDVAQSLDRGVEALPVLAGREDGEHRAGEFRRGLQDLEVAGFQVAPNHAERQIGGAAVDDDVAQGQGAVGDRDDGRSPLRERLCMVVAEVGAPVDVDVVLSGHAFGFRILADQDQPLLHELFDDQTGPVLRRIGHGQLDEAVDEMLHEMGRRADADPDGDIRQGVPDPGEPSDQQALPQGEFDADGDQPAELLGQTDFQAGVLPGLQELFGEGLELDPGGGQRGAAFRADEQLLAEGLLQALDAGADRRLGQVEAFRRLCEVAEVDDGEEGLGESEVHGKAIRSQGEGASSMTPLFDCCAKILI